MHTHGRTDEQDKTIMPVAILCWVEARGGATILRVRGTNITASEASRKFFGLYPHICHSGGTTATNRHTESLSDSVATISYWFIVLIQF